MNKMRHIFRLIIPSPRRPTTLRSASALIIFLAAFGGGCLFVDHQRILMFAEPLAFLRIRDKCVVVTRCLFFVR